MQFVYILVLFLFQLSVLIITKASLLSFITNLAGILYVSTLVFKKRYTFLMAMVFNAGCLVIGIKHGIYSEIIQQPMFFVFNLIGFANMNFDKDIPKLHIFLKRVSKVAPWKTILVSVCVTMVWFFVSYSLESPVWIRDGILGGLAITAQVFSIAENKYSWYYWMALNGLSLYTWFSLGNTVMGSLYSVYFLNAIVGLIVWSKKQGKLNFQSTYK